MAYEDDQQVVRTQTTSVDPVNPTQQSSVTTETTPAEVLQEERPVTPRDEHRINVAERIVWLIFGIIIGILALRFLLRLLGADPNNSFADLIYSLSEPFASPFFGLFNYSANLITGRFEFETLVAILVYALIGWVIAKIVTIGKR